MRGCQHFDSASFRFRSEGKPDLRTRDLTLPKLLVHSVLPLGDVVRECQLDEVPRPSQLSRPLFLELDLLRVVLLGLLRPRERERGLEETRTGEEGSSVG